MTNSGENRKPIFPQIFPQAESPEGSFRIQNYMRLFFLEIFGESVGVRTRDLLIKSQLLYRLSYALPLRGCDHPGRKWAEHRQATHCGQPKNSAFFGDRHISCRA